MEERRIDEDADWKDLAQEWDLRPDTVYLNHGSFGPAPRSVRETRRTWIDRIDAQPMDFYLRSLEPELWKARTSVARFFGTTAEQLVFVENATSGMNVVAGSFWLAPGDEVLLNNHEYGAVHRIWERKCRQSGARVVTASMPDRFQLVEAWKESLLSAVTPRTRLVVLSHITSPTALVWPVEQIIPEFQRQEIAVCIDGPHALVQIPLQLDRLDCDFYTASCHKWMCGPLGTGFLYVHPRQQARIQAPHLSWGRLLPAVPARWDEEFTWPGTRDPSGYLALPAALEFTVNVGVEAFRQRTGWLAEKAEQKLCNLFGTTPLGDRSSGWYRSMCHVPLPPGDWSRLQLDLWNGYRIEIPVIDFLDQWFIRVSCHLYNDLGQIEYLESALQQLCRAP